MRSACARAASRRRSHGRSTAHARRPSVDLDAVVGAEQPRLLERGIDAGGDVSRQLALEPELRGTRTTGDRVDRASRSFASAIAVATISSPMSPSFIGTRMRWNSAASGSSDRGDVLEQASPPARGGRRRRPPGPGEPRRPRVARARVRDHREHPDREGQRRPDERRDGSATPPIETFGRRETAAPTRARMRRRITASCAAVKAMRTPNE